MTFNEVAIALDAVTQTLKLEKLSGSIKLRLARHFNALSESFKDFVVIRDQGHEEIQKLRLSGPSESPEESRAIEKKVFEIQTKLNDALRQEATYEAGKTIKESELRKDSGSTVDGLHLATLIKYGIVEDDGEQ